MKKAMCLWFGLTVAITSPAFNGKYFQFPSRAEISSSLEAQCIQGGAKGDEGLFSGLGLLAAKIALDFHRLHKFCVSCRSPSASRSVPHAEGCRKASERVPRGLNQCRGRSETGTEEHRACLLCTDNSSAIYLELFSQNFWETNYASF